MNLYSRTRLYFRLSGTGHPFSSPHDGSLNCFELFKFHNCPQLWICPSKGHTMSAN